MPIQPTAIYRVRASGPRASVRRFLAEHPLEPQSVKFAGDGVRFDVFIAGALLTEFERFGLQVERSFDATAQGAERQAQVGKDNPFRVGGYPKGLGVKVMR